MRCKTQQNRVLRVEGVAIPFSEGRNRLCPPFCHPAVFSGLLSASGSGNRSNPLQNDDIQRIFLLLHRKGNEKGAPDEGSFVRIKVLRHNRNLSVYQNIKRTFKVRLPPCPPVFCAALHRVCIFLSDNAKVVKIPEFSKCGKFCGSRRFFCIFGPIGRRW